MWLNDTAQKQRYICSSGWPSLERVDQRKKSAKRWPWSVVLNAIKRSTKIQRSDQWIWQKRNQLGLSRVILVELVRGQLEWLERLRDEEEAGALKFFQKFCCERNKNVDCEIQSSFSF